MKKLLSLFFAFIMVFSIVGFAVSCGSQVETESSVTTQTTVTEKDTTSTTATETTAEVTTKATTTETTTEEPTTAVTTTQTTTEETTVQTTTVVTEHPATEPVVTETTATETTATETTVTETTTTETTVTETTTTETTVTETTVTETTVTETTVTETTVTETTVTETTVTETTVTETTVTETTATETTATETTVTETTATETTATETTAPVETTDVGAADKMPGYEHVDFGGKIFKFGTFFDENTAQFCDLQDFWTDSYSGNSLNDAVYERNQILKKLYNCTIEATEGNQEFEADLASGQGKFIGCTLRVGSMVSTFANGNYYNVLKFDIDYTQPWWDQAFFRDLVCNGKLFAVCGDANIRTFRTPWSIFYNKDLYESKFSDIDIYQLVREKKWTYDLLNKFVSDIKQDINGDQQYTAKEDAEDADIVGFATTQHIYRAFYYAAGLRSVISENGKFKNVIDNPNGADIMNKVSQVTAIDGFTIPGYSVAHKCFVQNKTLFCADLLGTAEDWIDYEDLRLGIIPIPSYEDGHEYQTYCDDHALALGISTAFGNLEEISNFLSVFYYHSSLTVRPAYINTMKYVVASDEESGDMVDLILNARVYDAGYLLGLAGSWDSAIQNFGEKGADKWAGYVKKNKTSIDSNIQTLEAKFDKIDDSY